MVDEQYVGYEDYRVLEKECPLYGHIVKREANYECFCYDCRNVKKDVSYEYEGKKYRCYSEFRRVKEQIQKEEMDRKIRESCTEGLNKARLIDTDKFFEICTMAHKTLVDERKALDENVRFAIMPPKGKSFLLYFFSNDEIVRIYVTGNPAMWVGSHAEKWMEMEKPEISCIEVAEDLASEIALALHIKNKKEIKFGLYKPDNAVFIKSKGMNTYLDENYGITRRQFESLRYKHLEMEEYFLYGNTYFLKKQIDDIIRQEYRKPDDQ